MHTVRGKLLSVLCVLAALFPALFAQAQSQTQTFTDSIPLSTTDWNKSVTVPRFDPNLGTLLKVEVSLSAAIETQYRLESLDAAPATLNASATGTITVRRPMSLSALTAALPSSSVTRNVSAYDGVRDYGGTSGFTVGPVSASASSTYATATYPPVTPDLALFSGTGTITLPVTATATSFRSGAGNLSAIILTSAKADVSVTYTYVPHVKITGTVWHETVTVNGVPQAGEPGVPGVSITLTGDTDGDGTTESVSTTTNTNGFYQFPNLYPGTYTVTESVPAGYFVSPGTATILTVPATTPGQTYPNNDFFLYTEGTLGDYVWYDINADGVQDSGEPGIPGVKLILKDANTGLPLATTTTDSTGHYMFTFLPPGYFMVCVDTTTLPAGMTATYDLDGGLDSCANALLGINEMRLDVDFGYTGTGSIGDRVWYDANGNGVQENTEAGIPNATVKLCAAGPDGDFGTADDIHYPAQTTDANGEYLFTLLPAGKYRVKVDAGTLPADYVQTFDYDGLGTPHRSEYTLAAGENERRQDFGYWQLGSISGTTYCDLNENDERDPSDPVLPGVTVTLTDGNGNFIASTTTDSNGFYIFTNLPPGDYKVSVPSVFEGKALSTESPIAVPLAAGEHKTDVDFGYVTSSIGDRVWRDDNGDGVQDSGEPGIPNVTVLLKDSDGNTVATDTTDADGYYLFPDLLPGTYTVCVDPASLPADYGQTYDADGLATPHQSTYALAMGEDNRDQDFGYRPLGSIAGTVFCDDNGNGMQDSGEPGIPNVTVTLKDDDGTILGTKMTDANGDYKFEDLPAGNYTVSVPPTADGKKLSTDSPQEVMLAAGEDKTDVDFGYKPGSISGRTYCIENGQGISGVVVTLTGTDVNGNPVNRTTTTGANGAYKFDKVIEGNYTVSAPATAAGKQLATDSPLTVVLAPGENRTDVDFGYREPANNNACIVGKLYCDNNNNCRQDSGECPLPGVIVTLKNANGVVIATTTTDAGGNYAFTGLAAGTYRVCVPDPANGLKLISSNNVSVSVVANGTSRRDFRYKGGVIKGALYYDANNNGERDCNEPGFSDICVQLKNENGDIIKTTTTDCNGYYQFRGCLPAGCYIVCAPETIGTKRVRDTHTLRVCIEPGEVSCYNDFGYVAGRKGATRTPGYWKTHLRAMQTAVGQHAIDLGYLQAGASPNGAQNLTYPTLGNVMAIFWASDTRQGCYNRTSLGKARMKLANHLMSAMANVSLLGTTTAQNGYSATLIADARAALDGTNVNLINSFISQLDGFNNSGDNIAFTSAQAQIAGPADPNGAKAAANRDNKGDINPGPAFR